MQEVITLSSEMEEPARDEMLDWFEIARPGETLLDTSDGGSDRAPNPDLPTDKAQGIPGEESSAEEDDAGARYQVST